MLRNPDYYIAENPRPQDCWDKYIIEVREHEETYCARSTIYGPAPLEDVLLKLQELRGAANG